MGNSETKIDFRRNVMELTSSQGASKAGDDVFWEQLMPGASGMAAKDLFNVMSPEDIRFLRDNSPNSLVGLVYKCVEYLVHARDAMCPESMHRRTINCVRILTRSIPFLLESSEWRGYFWTAMPPLESNAGSNAVPISTALLGSLSDLLFCPGFTIPALPSSLKVEKLSALDTCEHIWTAGVGFGAKTHSTALMDINRTEILKLILTCFSEVIYTPANDEKRLRWLTHFTSAENKNVLPLFTSLLNTICAYDPVGYGIPYNYLMVGDFREPLVQTSIQFLIVALDRESQPNEESGYVDNYFAHYLSRIHREEDFEFVLKGLTRLLNNPLQSTYLPNSSKRISFHEELLVLLWKCCEYNQKFLFYVLKTSDVLEILVPILYHVNDARTDPARVGLIHMGVFLILLLSGERNFGVRLNKPFNARIVLQDIKPFTGTHADLMIIVFHKLITVGNYRLQSLFDCLLTIIVNVSPYLKSLSMISANKLLHLMEAFSTPWFLFSTPANHHLIFFLLEIFNNLIQYQFDGNAPLVYTIIRNRQVFYKLSNLNTDAVAITRSLQKKKTAKPTEKLASAEDASAELVSPVEKEDIGGAAAETATSESTTCVPAGEGHSDNKPSSDIQSTLAKIPSINVMTDKAPEWNQQPQREASQDESWAPTPEWVEEWKKRMPLQTIMRPPEFRKQHQRWRTLPRRDDRFLPFDWEGVFNEAVRTFPEKIPKEETPKLWLTWVHRELDKREKEFTEPHREELRHRLRQLFGEVIPGEMHVFKNTYSTNKALWRVKHLIEVRPITFPEGEPTPEDVGTLELMHDGRCLLKTGEPNPGDMQTLVDKKKQFTPDYLASRLQSRDTQKKEIFEDTVYGPANISITD